MSFLDSIRKHARRMCTISYVRFIISMITVEPTFFFFAAANEIMGMARVNGLYWKICEQSYGGIAGVNCLDKRHGMLPYMREYVQDEVTRWGIFISLANLIPVAIVAPIYGAFSDRHGRKTVILLGLLGMLFMELVLIAETTWIWLPLWLFPLAAFVTTFVGFYGMFTSACYAYITDREPRRERRTMRFAILQVTSCTAATIMGFSITGYVARLTYNRIPIVSISLLMLSFFYSFVFLREVPPKVLEAQQKKEAEKLAASVNGRVLLPVVESENDRPTAAFSTTPNSTTTTTVSNGEQKSVAKERSPFAAWALIKDAVRTALKPREGHYRAYIWLVLVAYFLIATTAQAQSVVMRYFMIDKPLWWTTQEQTQFGGFTSLIRCFGTFISVGALKALGFHETSIMLIAVASIGAKFVMVASAQTTAIMYVAIVVGMGSYLTTFVSKSLVSQFVPNHEVGRVFALFQLVGDFATLAGQFALMGIYYGTRSIFPGIVFYVMAGCKVVAFCILLWIHIDYKRYRRQKAAREKFANETALAPGENSAQTGAANGVH